MARELSEILTTISEYGSWQTLSPLNVNSRNYLGETPLHTAALLGDKEAIQVLVKAGVEINALGEDGNTALHEAALGGHEEACSLLISLGADPSIKNDLDWTALEIMKRRDTAKKSPSS